MSQYTPEQLKEIVELNRKYWAGINGGKRADLCSADLRSADLRSADLRSANLCDVNLRDANLYGANLRSANLRSANLCDANLRDADLCDAKNLSPLQVAQLSIVPQTGAFEAWKKCRGNVIVRLQIPEDAKRSNSTGRKCRAEKALIVEVINANQGKSIRNPTVIYRVGETVVCDKWEEDRWIECGGGIHFFITREEAEAYDA
jgi:hypothetical protein